jgi:hypothetical protein
MQCAMPLGLHNMWKAQGFLKLLKHPHLCVYFFLGFTFDEEKKEKGCVSLVY